MIPGGKVLGSSLQMCHYLTSNGEAISLPSLYCPPGSDFRLNSELVGNLDKS